MLRKTINALLRWSGYELVAARCERDTFEHKLLHNLDELDPLERIRYAARVQSTLTSDERFFFEGDPVLQGQLYVADRRAIYRIVSTLKPKAVFEIGTYTGGGSTLFIAHALKHLGQGRLITLETDSRLNRLALDYYSSCLPELLPHVDFVNGSDPAVFRPHLLPQGLECVFLDGAEDARQTLDQFRFFEEYLRPGSVVMAHDWNTRKMEGLRPLLENDSAWSKTLELGPPVSVGFAAFTYRRSDKCPE